MVSSVLENDVRQFIEKELPVVTTFFLKKVVIGEDEPLQELHEWDDVGDMAEAYFQYFNVNADKFSLRNYYPWETSFFKRENQNLGKSVLTIRMFIESAKAGRWLYD
ncbi:hypothetical protein COO59_18760 [Mixta theicola]|uniref:Cytoplasmic protein n=1 Tax=Mixta theicola TaxID=1458355 RepID=A0A2K1Q583_9GAMM|nr:DUF1493 family protein [Mixta theicola]PNS10193.1 hypothetical protein COO59_18760 [Mixta theicola]GLR08497.1 hypothetical protein GCM10007905_12160 [Mixta theicola]